MNITGKELLSRMSKSKVREITQDVRDRWEWYGNIEDKVLHDKLIQYLRETWGDTDFETVMPEVK